VNEKQWLKSMQSSLWTILYTWQHVSTSCPDCKDGQRNSLSSLNRTLSKSTLTSPRRHRSSILLVSGLSLVRLHPSVGRGTTLAQKTLEVAELVLGKLFATLHISAKDHYDSDYLVC